MHIINEFKKCLMTEIFLNFFERLGFLLKTLNICLSPISTIEVTLMGPPCLVNVVPKTLES